MKKMMINLNSFDKIKSFINMSDKLDCELDLVSGRYVVNGKSVMGVFSLDLSKPVEAVIYDTDNNPDYYPEELEQFKAS